METLLANRLDDRAILFGKLLAALAYGWILTLLSLVVGASSVSLMYGQGHFYFYSVAIGASVLALTTLGGLLVATVGVLISLSAPTVCQAYQRLCIALLLAFLPVFSTQYLPATLRAAVLPAEQSWLLLALAAASVLALLDWWVLALAVSRFQQAACRPNQCVSAHHHQVGFGLFGHGHNYQSGVADHRLRRGIDAVGTQAAGRESQRVLRRLVGDHVLGNATEPEPAELATPVAITASSRWPPPVSAPAPPTSSRGLRTQAVVPPPPGGRRRGGPEDSL